MFFRKFEWQLVGDMILSFFFWRCMSSVFVNQVLLSDDHRHCESQKCEKLLSFCAIFYHNFLSSCLLYQRCPECHDLPIVIESRQCCVFSQSVLHQSRWPHSVLLLSLIKLDFRTDAEPVR
ncbi:hypothetical protein MTO96_008400 [Rhipicephalus appendiculatus]